MKVGILGGTFDPIHYGHTYVAQKVQEKLALQQVLFLVSNIPPHKVQRPLTSPFHRYAMVVLATDGVDSFLACPWELEQSAPSYTLDALRYWREALAPATCCFIAGSDSLQEIHIWKECDTLLSEFSFVFVQRPGSEVDLRKLKISDRLSDSIHVLSGKEPPLLEAGRSCLVSLDAPAVSSTKIRETLALGEPIPAGHLSQPVHRYIIKHRLYEAKETGSGSP